MKHIASLNTLRFSAIIFIVLFHTSCTFWQQSDFFCAFLAVEILFTLSGFLLAKTYKMLTLKKTPIEQYTKYCTNRFMRLWPEYIFVMLISVLILGVFSKINVQPFWLNVFMIQGIGGIPVFSYPLWYVPTVFLCGCLLFGLILFRKDSIVILPLLGFLCLFYFIQTKNFDAPYGVFATIIPTAIIRGLLGMIIGMYTWWICEKITRLKKRLNSKLIPFILFIGEVVSVFALFYTLAFQGEHNVSDFNIYFYAAFLIGLLYFKKEKLLKFMSWKIWKPFAKISYMLYLIHFTVLEIFKTHYFHFTKENTLRGYVMVLVSCLLFAFLCHYVFIWMCPRIKKLILKT